MIPIWPAWFWTALVLAIMLLPAGSAGRCRVGQAADRSFVAAASARRLAIVGSLYRTGDLRTDISARRGLLQLGRGVADAVAIDHHETQSCSNGTRPPMRNKASRTDLAGIVRAMWFAPVLALLLGGYLARFRPDALPVSIPLLSLWLISPAIAWWLSRPLPSRTARLNRDDIGVSRRAVAQDVAVLRDLRRPGRQLASARQLSGLPGACHRPPNVAHEHGFGLVVESGRL